MPTAEVRYLPENGPQLTCQKKEVFTAYRTPSNLSFKQTMRDCAHAVPWHKQACQPCLRGSPQGMQMLLSYARTPVPPSDKSQQSTKGCKASLWLLLTASLGGAQTCIAKARHLRRHGRGVLRLQLEAVLGRLRVVVGVPVVRLRQLRGVVHQRGDAGGPGDPDRARFAALCTPHKVQWAQSNDYLKRPESACFLP